MTVSAQCSSLSESWNHPYSDAVSEVFPVICEGKRIADYKLILVIVSHRAEMNL